MPDKKRIALFTRYLTMGGIQKVMARLANGFAARGHPVDLVLAKGAGPIADEVSSKVRIVDLCANRVWAALPALMRYLRSASPAVLLSGEVPSNLVAMGAKTLSSVDTMFVVTVHQHTSLHAKTGDMWYRRLLPSLIRAFYPRAHRVVTVSGGIKDDLERLSTRVSRKAQVIYNPVVDSNLIDRANEPISHPWLKNREVPVILGVGRLTHEKNYELLLRAVAQVAVRRSVRLIILGEGKQRGHLERITRELGLEEVVDMHGVVNNPYPYMTNASLLALSSIFEGLPTVLIEALACGCPVVSTDCPSGPREILDDGTWGHLVPVNDKDALAAAIRQSLSESHDPDRLQERAWDFSVEKSIDRYLDLFFPHTRSESASASPLHH
jgi:glycosyltransferase involved in cell wall biosynthesis